MRAVAKYPGERWPTVMDFARAFDDADSTARRMLPQPVSALLGTFELGPVIAHGRFGSEIHAGTHRALGHPVAIRTFRHAGRADREAVRARFLREARTLQVPHPNLIQVRDFGEDEFFREDRPRSQEKVELGRDHLTRRVLEKASPTLRTLGVELVDVQFKRINYVDEVQVKVFERMISERRRIAERFRSEGQGQSAEIRGRKERELKAIRSEAFRRTQELKGKADAEASRIYAGAYGKDPGFYAFWRSLDTLRTTVDAQTTMLLGTEGELYRHLGSSRPARP